MSEPRGVYQVETLEWYERQLVAYDSCIATLARILASHQAGRAKILAEITKLAEEKINDNDTKKSTD